MVGIDYAPSLLILVGSILGGMIVLHLTIIISQQSMLIKDLYKELSLVKQGMRKIEKNEKQK